jgi:alkaline phosphatase D
LPRRDVDALWYDSRMSYPDRRRRHVLAALTSSAAGLGAPWFARDARAADVDRFALGVASGQPRPDGMVLWTRLTGHDLPEQVPVRWEVADDEAFTKVVLRGEFVAQDVWAHSVHAEPKGLASDRWYWYRFRALGAQSRPARTRTAPADDAKAAVLRFAIASCQRFDTGHYAAWRELASRSLDAVIFLGDYIYEFGSRPGALREVPDGLTTTLDGYRARYALYRSDPLLQAAHAACPWWLVWDDHEVDNDYAGDQGQGLEPDFARRRAWAYQAYWEHMPFTMAQRPRWGSMRVHDRFHWGRLATLHLLDDRQYRDPQACPGPGRGGSRTLPASECPELDDPRRSLLGAEQERWFVDGLDLERPWNLVAQQTLMAPFTWRDPGLNAPPRSLRSLPPEGALAASQRPGTGDGAVIWTDGWDGYPHARRRLLDAIADRGLRGTVVLGGDVHTHYVATLEREGRDRDRRGGGAVVASEFVCTSISTPSLPQSRLDTLLPFNPHVHLGRSDRRGATVFEVDTKAMRAELLGVDDVRRADSAVSTVARFVVDAARPGPQVG